MLDGLALNICREDFSYFRTILLKRKPARMYDEIINTILNDPRHVVIQAARQHGKTTLLSIDFPLWMMWRNENPEKNKRLNFCILSASLDQSSDILELMKKEIMDNDELKRVLLPTRLFDASWSQSKIITKNGHKVQTIPFGSSIRGRAIDYCIMDDIQKREQANPQYTRDTFFGEIFPVVAAKKGKHILVGTPLFFDDIFKELEKPQYAKQYACLKYPAVIVDSDGKWKEPQCPELYTLQQLRELKESVPLFAWIREFQLEITSSDISLFPYEILSQACDLQTYETKDRKHFYMGCDIAMSEKSDADFSAYIVGYKQGNNPIIIDHIEHFKGKSSKEQVELIAQLHKKYKFEKVVVEKTGLGMGMIKDLQVIDVGHFLEPFDTKHKNKEEIFGDLEVALRQGKIKLPKDDRLIKELVNISVIRKKRRDGSYEQTIQGISGSHDDLCVSLALMYHAYMLTQATRPSIAFI